MPYIYKSGLQFGINETNIYGGASYVELTQAEYDALSDAEKHNGQIYFITDGNYDFLIVNDSVPVGSIQAYGGTAAPSGWLICDGRAISRTSYKELFQAIGISFGEGDGSTTFNIPDLRGRTTIGNGLGTASNAVNRIIGQTGGSEKVTLSVNQLPSHVHKFNRQQWYGSDTQTTTSTGTIYSWKTTTGGSTSYGYQGTDDQYGPTGGGQAHDNMQPYLTTNYIIKAKNPSITSGQQLQAMELFYPVGSYFETSDSTFDPNVEWGGTWTSESYSNDIIIEEGISGIWTYRKWSSGFAQCWGTYVNNSVVVNTTWGTMYEGLIGNITYPNNLFIDLPNVLTTFQNNAVAGWIEMAGGKSKTQTGSIYAVRPIKTDTAYSYGVHIYASGFWKTYVTPTLNYKWKRTA